MKIPDRSQKGKATLCSLFATFVASAGQPVEANWANSYAAPDIHQQVNNFMQGLCQSKKKDEDER